MILLYISPLERMPNMLALTSQLSLVSSEISPSWLECLLPCCPVDSSSHSSVSDSTSSNPLAFTSSEHSSPYKWGTHSCRNLYSSSTLRHNHHCLIIIIGVSIKIKWNTKVTMLLYITRRVLSVLVIVWIISKNSIHSFKFLQIRNIL